MESLRGTGVAIVTPFDSANNIDYPALERLVEHLITNGIDYLVVQGTTGESVTMSPEEKKQSLAFVIKINNGRLPIVLGIGGNCTATVVEAFKTTNLTGVDAILSVSPYYNKPTQEGIYQHYKALSEISTKPIILYNVPGRTSSNVLAQTTIRIANDFKNIVAVKEASGSLEQAMEIINGAPSDFLVISGDDALTLPMVASGGAGVISVIANGFPKGFSDMVNAALNGKIEDARTLHYKYFSIIDCLFAEGNPAGIKAVLKELNIMEENVRLPLIPISSELKSKIVSIMTKY